MQFEQPFELPDAVVEFMHEVLQAEKHALLQVPLQEAGDQYALALQLFLQFAVHVPLQLPPPPDDPLSESSSSSLLQEVSMDGPNTIVPIIGNTVCRDFLKKSLRD